MEKRTADADLPSQMADVVTSVRQLREDPEPNRVGQCGQHPQQLVATQGHRCQCVLLLHM